MNSEWAAPRRARFDGVRTGLDWRLRLYVVSSSGAGVTSRETELGNDAVDSCLGTVTFDPDYQMFRVGTALAHFGRRGLTITLVHYGLWDDMFEVFIRGWYRYNGRSEFEEATPADPMLCYHDIPIILPEIALAHSTIATAHSAGTAQWDEIMTAYLNARPISHG
ncbi:hypothetical protein AB0H34_35900 [Saccharopolyspora shandongensis]|uniref:hypothetical protein n=1 Tax=Saccharopolyspora shandongensis TaxID=418495 RepID=UPI00340EC85F